MAQCTPVITTERTAGPDIIKDGESGWIADAGSVDSLKNIIEKLLSNPELIKEAGIQSSITAQKRNWDIYGKELCSAVR